MTIKSSSYREPQKSQTEILYNTKTPYLQLGGQTLLTKFKSMISPINPFALDQSENPNKITYSILSKKGTMFNPLPLPNPVQYRSFLPVHNDELTDTTYERHNMSTGKESSGDHSMLSLEPIGLPVACD